VEVSWPTLTYYPTNCMGN